MLLATTGAWAQTAITAVSDLNNTSFYTIKSVNRGYLYYDATHPDNVTSSSHTNIVDATPTNEEGTTTEQFAFLHGDYTPAGQYYLYNRAAQKFVSWAGGETVALTLTAEPQCTWSVDANSTYFTIKVPGTNQQYINITNWNAQYGCKVFATSADEGNKMTITDVCTAADDANAALAKVKLKEGKALMQTGLGYPQTTSEAYTTLDGMAYESATLADVEAAVQAYIECTDITLPVSGKAYTIKAWWKTRELPLTFFDAQVSGVFQGRVNVYAPNSTEGVEATKFLCQEVDGKYLFVSDNGYYFGWQGDTGTPQYTALTYSADQLFYVKKAYIDNRGDARNNVTVSELFGKLCLQSAGANGEHNMMFSFNTKKYHSAYAHDTYYSDNAHTVYFILEEVPEADYTTNVIDVNAAAGLNGSYVATYYAPYATVLPADYTAYTINTVDATAGRAIMTPVEGDIPANTGVIVMAPAAGQARLFLSTTNPAAIDGNKLRGSVGVSYPGAATAYVLAKGAETGVGLYRPQANKDADGNDATGTDATCFKNNAGKAYLFSGDEPQNGRALSFYFGGTETGIEETGEAGGVQPGNATTVYDLSGRRVQRMGKGLYIVNGKKMVK